MHYLHEIMYNYTHLDKMRISRIGEPLHSWVICRQIVPMAGADTPGLSLLWYPLQHSGADRRVSAPSEGTRRSIGDACYMITYTHLCTRTIQINVQNT